MTDRYGTPRWDDEPEQLGERDAVTDAPPAADANGAADEPDLDASSENVLDGWPLVDVVPTDDVDDVAEVAEPAAPEVAEPAAAEAAPEPAAPEEAVAAIAAPEVEEPETTPAFADHVSATMEHAPGDLTVPPGYSVLEGEASGERRAVGVVVARFNGDVTTQLLESALAELDACGVSRDAVTVMPVPGAFELPLAAMALAKTRRFACIVALGCVIRGDTPHFDYVSSEAASGLQLAAIETGVPVAFGLLTLDRADQAESRTGKGAEAVRTGLEMADLFANLRAAAAR
jgi:6,7-dimethyl-8-ribityllumazine synthase